MIQKSPFVCVLVVSSASFVFSSLCIAAELIALQHRPLEYLSSFKTPRGRALSAQSKASFSADNLRLVGQHTDNHQVQHERLQQFYAGFPVFGGYALVHRYPKSILPSKTELSGALYKDLAADLGDVPANFEQGAEPALQNFAAGFNQAQILEKKTKPMVYVDGQGTAHWAYQLSVHLHVPDESDKRPSAIVDASDKHIFVRWDDIKTLIKIVNGVGYGGNLRTGKHQFGKDLPYLRLTFNDFSGQCFLENAQARVVDMRYHDDIPNSPMGFDCELNDDLQAFWTGYHGDGYDIKNGAFSPSNDALYLAGQVADFYKNTYGVDVLSFGKQPLQLIMRVHYGHHLTNAFWDGKQMTFGDGDEDWYPFVSLDIGAHEISHGFTEQHSNLIYFGQSGGINEAFSDMAAQAIEYQHQGFNNWQIGAGIIKDHRNISAMRFLDVPSRDGLSIDNAYDYEPYMDVHYSSGVYNRLFYLMSHRPGWDPVRAFAVMIKANMDYWTPYSSFEDAACGVRMATRDLGYSVADVDESLQAVMIDYDDC